MHDLLKKSSFYLLTTLSLCSLGGSFAQASGKSLLKKIPSLKIENYEVKSSEDLSYLAELLFLEPEDWPDSFVGLSSLEAPHAESSVLSGSFNSYQYVYEKALFENVDLSMSEKEKTPLLSRIVHADGITGYQIKVPPSQCFRETFHPENYLEENGAEQMRKAFLHIQKMLLVTLPHFAMDTQLRLKGKKGLHTPLNIYLCSIPRSGHSFARTEGYPWNPRGVSRKDAAPAPLHLEYDWGQRNLWVYMQSASMNPRAFGELYDKGDFFKPFDFEVLGKLFEEKKKNMSSAQKLVTSLMGKSLLSSLAEKPDLLLTLINKVLWKVYNERDPLRVLLQKQLLSWSSSFQKNTSLSSFSEDFWSGVPADQKLAFQEGRRDLFDRVWQERYEILSEEEKFKWNRRTHFALASLHLGESLNEELIALSDYEKSYFLLSYHAETSSQKFWERWNAAGIHLKVYKVFSSFFPKAPRAQLKLHQSSGDQEASSWVVSPLFWAKTNGSVNVSNPHYIETFVGRGLENSEDLSLVKDVVEREEKKIDADIQYEIIQEGSVNVFTPDFVVTHLNLEALPFTQSDIKNNTARRLLNEIDFIRKFH